VPGWDPVELEGPEWLNGEKARDDPEAGQERGSSMMKSDDSKIIHDEILLGMQIQLLVNPGSAEKIPTTISSREG
jgi:hypothetical protein